MKEYTLMLITINAKGSAEDVVLDKGNCSFQSQSEEASSSKRSSRRTGVEAVSA